jgi:hypothetical protein
MTSSASGGDDPFLPQAQADLRAFTAILDIIQQHLASSAHSSDISLRETSISEGDLQITPGFLFAVCAVLSANVASGPLAQATSGSSTNAHILPAVLRCLRHNWRTQPSHTRSASALARNLAALASSSLISHTSGTHQTLKSWHRVLDSPGKPSFAPTTHMTTNRIKAIPEKPTAREESIEASRFQDNCTGCRCPKSPMFEMEGALARLAHPNA